MAAKIFSPPTSEVGNPPPFTTQYDEYEKRCEEWTNKVREWAKKISKTPDNDLVGMIYRYPVADGYAH